MNHTKLRCYQRMIKVIKILQKDMPTWPRGHGNLVDQIRRASTSAVLNLVEGNGRTSKKDRRRFFVQSTSSFSEVSAGLELMAIYHSPYEKQSLALREEIRRITGMVFKLP